MTEKEAKESADGKLEIIRKHLDFIDECVVSQNFEDIPDQVDCIRDELNKQHEKKSGSR
ncbi:MAG: hypothetical protein HKM93_08970 [Desulfobacteraceae bacterium]|nr:hypothetical protein [Desulfobacteraceae bacterium]